MGPILLPTIISGIIVVCCFLLIVVVVDVVHKHKHTNTLVTNLYNLGQPLFEIIQNQINI